MRLLADGLEMASGADRSLIGSGPEGVNDDVSQQNQTASRQLLTDQVEASSPSMEMARPLAPRQPRRLREYLREQQLTVMESDLQSSLSSERQMQGVQMVAAHAHVQGFSKANSEQSEAVQSGSQAFFSPFQLVQQPGSAQAEKLPGISPFHFAQPNQHSQGSTPRFHSRSASTDVGLLTQEHAAVHNGPLIRASRTGDTLRGSGEILRLMPNLQDRRHTEDPAEMSGFQLRALQAVGKASSSKPPLGLSRTSSKTERRRSRLAPIMSGSLPDLDGHKAGRGGNVSPSPSMTPRRLSSLAKTSGSFSDISIREFSPTASDKSHTPPTRTPSSLASVPSGCVLDLSQEATVLRRTRSELSLDARAAIESMNCATIEFGQLQISRKIGDGSMGQV